MSKKLILTFSLVLLVFPGSGLGMEMQWTNATGDGLWTTDTNWNPPYEPTIATEDKAKINRTDGPLISNGMAAQCQWLALSNGAPATMRMTGGTLNVSGTGDSWSIIAYGPADVGTLTMDDGIITTSNRVFVGFQGQGTVIVNGGTINIGGTFGIGYGETSFTTGRGYVYLNGGTINVAGTFLMSSPAGALGKLDLSGGTLNVTGDKRTTINDYISNGYIVAFNGMGLVNVTYDGAKTIVTGAMNPNIARVPVPANTTADVAPYVTLGWMAGDSAITQDIYLGTDAVAVNGATPATTGIYRGSQGREECTFEPRGLELGTTYYWRIDSVDAAMTHKGNLWQFTVADCALVDNFESYADSAVLQSAWMTGAAGAVSLAATGGRDGSKAMSFTYDNSGAGSKPYYSETFTAAIDYDWTISGVLAVDIWYKGAAGNAAEPMYAAIEDNNGNPVAVVTNDDAAAAQAEDWQVWRIAIEDFAVNHANIKKFYIGFGDRNSPVAGGSGTVYFDDIALYPSRCLYSVIADINEDCYVDFDDFLIMSQNWMCVSGL